MKYKVVPEPRSVAFVGEARRTLVLVPENEDDCCVRLLDGTDLETHEDAREWVAFLRALGLVERTESGVRRLRGNPTKTALARAFRERVFGAETVVDALSTRGPLGVDGVFERVREDVPTWERHRRTDWEADWHERVRRLLGWTVEFGLAERVDDGWVA